MGSFGDNRSLNGLSFPPCWFTVVMVRSVNLEHRALVVEVELESGDQVLLFWGQILSDGGGQRDGALRGGGDCGHASRQPRTCADLQHKDIQL